MGSKRYDSDKTRSLADSEKWRTGVPEYWNQIHGFPKSDALGQRPLRKMTNSSKFDRPRILLRYVTKQ